MDGHFTLLWHNSKLAAARDKIIYKEQIDKIAGWFRN